MNDLSVPEKEASGFEMRPRSLEEAMKFCELMAHSDLVPAAYKGKPGNIMVAIQFGNELGMTPMRALRSIAVINGRATMWGDELLAMVLNSPVCEYVSETQSTEKVGVCVVKRKGAPEHVSTFTLEDAKRAGLLGKQGPWQQYTKRMLTLRARGFALRDQFADVLAGLVSTEEAMDIPAEAVPETPKPEVRTLKEVLKLQVESAQPEGAAPVDIESTGVSEGGEPATPPPPPAPSTLLEEDDPSSPWKAKIRTAHDSKAVNAVWRQIPEELKQDVYATYSDRLKSLKGS